jgi:S-adenosylmethionine:tRNA ribosyltransferase-isomerase
MEAAQPRDSSRLLVLDRSTGALEDRIFGELPDLLRHDDILVMNDTKVFPARLLGHKKTGGKAEIFLLERIEGDRWKALVKPGRRLPPGTVIRVSEAMSVEVDERLPDGARIVILKHHGDLWADLERCGHTPLPLYIDRPDRLADRERYQTVYARNRGAVAAPTAGLHFTPELLKKIELRGIQIAKITLHVGWGTFKGIDESDIRDHKMHDEYYEIGAEAASSINKAINDKRRIVAVGTTTVRALESAAHKNLPLEPTSEKTNIFIYPGFDFKATGAIVTNFHLPKSSLIVMVSAFAGREKIMHAYEHAVAERYRFYSYGDAMFIA